MQELAKRPVPARDFKHFCRDFKAKFNPSEHDIPHHEALQKICNGCPGITAGFVRCLQAQTQAIKDTLNPQRMKKLDVPHPAEYASQIRFSGSDLIGRFFIPFLESKQHQYHLHEQATGNQTVNVFVHEQATDANQKRRTSYD